MAIELEDFYAEIGQAAVNQAADRSGKLVIYAEVQDGMISADIFYCLLNHTVLYKFASDELEEIILQFWLSWQQTPGYNEWRCMTYVIEGDDFTANFTYPDQINEDDDVSDRRPKVLKEQFGDVTIDYSNPD